MVFAVDSWGEPAVIDFESFFNWQSLWFGFIWLFAFDKLIACKLGHNVHIYIYKYLMGLGIWMVDICRNRGNYSKGSIFGGEVKASRYWFWVSVLVMLCKLISCLLLPRPTPFHTHMYAGCV